MKLRFSSSTSRGTSTLSPSLNAPTGICPTIVPRMRRYAVTASMAIVQSARMHIGPRIASARMTGILAPGGERGLPGANGARAERRSPTPSGRDSGDLHDAEPGELGLDAAAVAGHHGDQALGGQSGSGVGEQVGGGNRLVFDSLQGEGARRLARAHGADQGGLEAVEGLQTAVDP